MTRFREFCIFFFLARINPTNREIPHARNRTQNAPEQINNSRRQCKQTNNSKLLRKITTIGTDTNRALEISARETTTISGPIRLVATSLTTSSPPSVCQLLWFCLRLCGCGCAISARTVCLSLWPVAVEWVCFDSWPSRGGVCERSSEKCGFVYVSARLMRQTGVGANGLI